jgi:hypothetical protein
MKMLDSINEYDGLTRGDGNSRGALPAKASERDFVNSIVHGNYALESAYVEHDDDFPEHLDQDELREASAARVAAMEEEQQHRFEEMTRARQSREFALLTDFSGDWADVVSDSDEEPDLWNPADDTEFSGDNDFANFFNATRRYQKESGIAEATPVESMKLNLLKFYGAEKAKAFVTSMIKHTNNEVAMKFADFLSNRKITHELVSEGVSVDHVVYRDYFGIFTRFITLCREAKDRKLELRSRVTASKSEYKARVRGSTGVLAGNSSGSKVIVHTDKGATPLEENITAPLKTTFKEDLTPYVLETRHADSDLKATLDRILAFMEGNSTARNQAPSVTTAHEKQTAPVVEKAVPKKEKKAHEPTTPSKKPSPKKETTVKAKVPITEGQDMDAGFEAPKEASKNKKRKEAKKAAVEAAAEKSVAPKGQAPKAPLAQNATSVPVASSSSGRSREVVDRQPNLGKASGRKAQKEEEGFHPESFISGPPTVVRMPEQFIMQIGREMAVATCRCLSISNVIFHTIKHREEGINHNGEVVEGSISYFDQDKTSKWEFTGVLHTNSVNDHCFVKVPVDCFPPTVLDHLRKNAFSPAVRPPTKSGTAKILTLNGEQLFSQATECVYTDENDTVKYNASMFFVDSSGGKFAPGCCGTLVHCGLTYVHVAGNNQNGVGLRMPTETPSFKRVSFQYTDHTGAERTF